MTQSFAFSAAVKGGDYAHDSPEKKKAKREKKDGRDASNSDSNDGEGPKKKRIYKRGADAG